MSALGESGSDLGAWVERLVSSLGLPTRLRELGLTQAELPCIAQKSLHDPGIPSTPLAPILYGGSLSLWCYSCSLSPSVELLSPD